MNALAVGLGVGAVTTAGMAIGLSVAEARTDGPIKRGDTASLIGAVGTGAMLVGIGAFAVKLGETSLGASFIGGTLGIFAGAAVGDVIGHALHD